MRRELIGCAGKLGWWIDARRFCQIEHRVYIYIYTMSRDLNLWTFHAHLPVHRLPVQRDQQSEERIDEDDPAGVGWFIQVQHRRGGEVQESMDDSVGCPPGHPATLWCIKARVGRVEREKPESNDEEHGL